MGVYIVDFVCLEKNLAIELDGKQHSTVAGLRRDKARDEELAALNLRVLRFPNDRIRLDLDSVLKEINDMASAPSPLPPPAGEGSASPAHSA